jgi:hypothetical protein
MYMLFKTSVVGDPYIDLNDCIPTQVMNCGIGTFVHLDHVSYGPSLEATDYNAGFLGELGSFDTFGSNTFGYRTKDVTAPCQSIRMVARIW